MSQWNDICSVDDILPNNGCCALFKGEQVAIFRVSHRDSEAFYALANYDPCSGANVISRGIVGSIGERLVVASPMYKQHFCLHSGECLEEDGIRLQTWPVRVEGDRVLLAD